MYMASKWILLALFMPWLHLDCSAEQAVVHKELRMMENERHWECFALCFQPHYWAIYLMYI